MSSLDVEIAWAIPVEATRLVAHLTAHLNLIPVTETLRLCNRYGRGTQAYITKLPLELVKYIESCLVLDQRASELREYELWYKCVTETCGWRDHFSSKQLLRFYANCIPEGEFEPLHPDQTELTESQLALLTDCRLPEDVVWDHADNQYDWNSAVDAGWVHSIFSRKKKITRLFGLEIHISHPNIGIPFVTGHPRDDCDCDTLKVEGSYPAVVTIVHLTLPGTTHIERDLRMGERYGRPVGTVAVVAQPIVQPQLTEAAKKKFSRMMKILDLEVYPTERHAARILQAHEETCTFRLENDDQGPSETKGISGEAQHWPQLMLLATAELKTDPY